MRKSQNEMKPVLVAMTSIYTKFTRLTFAYSHHEMKRSHNEKKKYKKNLRKTQKKIFDFMVNNGCPLFCGFTNRSRHSAINAKEYWFFFYFVALRVLMFSSLTLLFSKLLLLWLRLLSLPFCCSFCLRLHFQSCVHCGCLSSYYFFQLLLLHWNSY